MVTIPYIYLPGFSTIPVWFFIAGFLKHQLLWEVLMIDLQDAGFLGEAFSRWTHPSPGWCWTNPHLLGTHLSSSFRIRKIVIQASHECSSLRLSAAQAPFFGCETNFLKPSWFKPKNVFQQKLQEDIEKNQLNNKHIKQKFNKSCFTPPFWLNCRVSQAKIYPPPPRWTSDLEERSTPGQGGKTSGFFSKRNLIRGMIYTYTPKDAWKNPSDPNGKNCICIIYLHSWWSLSWLVFMVHVGKTIYLPTSNDGW